MWKDFVAINGSECVRALICIAIDDPLGGSNHLHSRRLQIAYTYGSDSKSSKGITYSEQDRLWQLKVVRGDSLWQP